MADDEGVPIAYSALGKGVQVVTEAGRSIGSVDRVLGEPAEDIFHGIVVATPVGRRVVDRQHVATITTTLVTVALTDAELDGLPEPSAAALAGDGGPVRRRPEARGGVVVVRCSRGALFETLWVPGVSLKAIRLGNWRIQRCPVHDRAELVQRVDPRALTYAERASAARYPAGWVP